MLTFVGLGLYDDRSLTLEARDTLQTADRVFAETYTSRLIGADLTDVADAHGVSIERRSRAGVERDPEPILSAAESGHAVFCTPGDPMIATTHTDLRLRAADRGIDTSVVHGVTASAAIASITGLQNYRFGRAVTLPFPFAHGGPPVPGDVRDGIADNRTRGLHTLVFLDIKAADASPAGPDGDRFMTADHAARLLCGRDDPDDNGETTDAETDRGTTDATLDPETPAVVVARAGAPNAVVRADSLAVLADETFGPPLHALVIPGELHPIERDALETFGNAPS